MVGNCFAPSDVEHTSLNSIIQYDHFDELSETILQYLNPSSVINFALVCKRTMEIVSHHAPSARKAIHNVRFRRLLVHRNFKSILTKIEDENMKTQKAKFTQLMIEFFEENCVFHGSQAKYKICELSYLQLGELNF